ncbi:MAG: FAD-dependent oxidoreductase [Rhodobiaceae bacterium]|nr:FAD-dependent oxidoreductase [Rhodobiaceae bacterium]MCC0018177.1 FAD-dependent oxidoreductase [Rhodobiaceae bacterium]MCC0051257.1 FAD-dependent oxidoreductase [Rhodobiaceae bacterium]
MPGLNIAVVGSGISGLSAAWLLSRRHQVTVYECDQRLGGHANTVDVELSDGTVDVDTGFIVYNEKTYPNLTALFAHLGVKTQPSSMGFALSVGSGTYEYSGTNANGYFGQRRNIASPSHWALLLEIRRFFDTAASRVETHAGEPTLGDFLRAEGYSSRFVEEHIVPMGAAIWSTTLREMLNFPARTFLAFYGNHGLLQLSDRPAWRTVCGGSRNYVSALISDADFRVIQGVGARRVARSASKVVLEDTRGAMRPFDHVVFATHADQALSLIEAPSDEETTLLGSFAYQPNEAVLHSDRRWMPQRRRVWSSWNFIKSERGLESPLCLTYWMNELQGLETRVPLLVTLNPTADIHPKAVHRTFSYRHPVFNAAALAAQKRLWNLQGRQRTWFCGSYFGYGFHEDGIQSGLAVAEQLGGVRRPWQVADESGRINLAAGDAAEAAE